MRSFAETLKNQPVQYKVRHIAQKMELLDREVKYLLNKVKIRKPKPETTASNKTERSTEETKESAEEEEETERPETSNTEEDTLVLPENDKSQQTTDTQIPEEDEHQEL